MTATAATQMIPVPPLNQVTYCPRLITSSMSIV